MYTQQHYAWMERFEFGMVWVWHRDLSADSVLRFLMQEGLIAPREDIQPGQLVLTERGKSVLETKRKAESEEKQRRAEHDTARAERLAERREDHAREERYHRTQNKIAVWSILVPAITFVLGMLVECFTGAAGTVIQVFIHF